MVDMFAQAYHWTLPDIAKLSYIQVILLNHAAVHNKKVLDKRIEAGDVSDREALATAPLVNGKRMDELTSDEIMAMASKSGKAPKSVKVKKDVPEDSSE